MISSALKAEAASLEPELQARGLQFSHQDEVELLSGVDLECRAGSTTAIMGPSGCGKSTLLHLLAGLLTPSAGEIVLGGEQFSTQRARNRTRMRQSSIGMVFQFGELLAELTLAENVELPMMLLGHRRGEARRRSMALLDQVGIADLKDRYPHQVSGGQQQRAAIARAIVHRPRVLLADEPTGALDDSTSESVLGVLLGMAQSEGVAIVMATHSPWVASQCDERFVLSNQRLVRTHG